MASKPERTISSGLSTNRELTRLSATRTFEGRDAAKTTFEVGYERISQFDRQQSCQHMWLFWRHRSQNEGTG
jgi:hypothetical protein